MFVRRRNMTSHEYNWNHSFTNRIILAVVLLTSSVDIIAGNVHLMEGGSNQEINCTIYRSCTQCADASICSWLMEKQICVHSSHSLSENFIVDTKESCPDFAVALKSYDNHYLIGVTVLNYALKSVKYFFNENAVISCEIENSTYSASIDNGVITCAQVKLKTISPEERRTTSTNPLFIFYFSIVVNNVRLQFNDPRDHYISYHGWTCPNKNCAIGFWESDAKKYYCKWCLKNDGCQITAEQQNSCDVRNAINNEKWNDDTSLSTIEVKSPDVAIESFKPDVLMNVRRSAVVVSITVKNHRYLADGRSTTVTVAGKRCDDPITVDDQTVNCTISKENIGIVEGPVVVEYALQKSVVTLMSARKFKFVEPKFLDIRPMCVPVTGDTRIELIGEYLNVSTDVEVFFKNIRTKVMCKIVAFDRDRIDCVTSPFADGPKSGPLQIVYENIVGKFCKKQNFKYVAEPTVRNGQVFEGVASGDVPMTVLGSFDCTENQQMYVEYNGTRYYGHCVLHHNSRGDAESMMDCWPPKLDCPAQTTNLPLGFQVDLAGKVVHIQQQVPYLLHPDPVYTDFVVQDDTTICVNGVFPDLLQRRRPNSGYSLEVAFRGDQVDVDEGCTVTNVTGNHVECRSLSGTSVAQVLEIAIAVGKQVRWTVVHRRQKQYYAIVRLLRPQYVVGGISLLFICAFALYFCVKKIMNKSKQRIDKRYLGELRNITAGIDDSNHYLMNE